MIYCMSDIHGEIDKFYEMLKLIEFSDKDTLYVIGDVIDGNPNGIDILEEIMYTENIKFIRGNHEQMCLDTFWHCPSYNAKGVWKSNGGNVTYRELTYVVSPEDRNRILKFISESPLYLDITVNDRKFHLVHGWPSYLEEDMVWGRPQDGLGEVWEDDVTPIIGHTPTILLYPDDHESPFHIYHSPLGYITIDCGCGNKTERRRLACLRLDDMKEYYV